MTSSAIHPQIRFKIRSSIASVLPLIPLRLRGHLSGLHLPVNIKTKPDTEKMPSQIYNQLLADFSEDIKSLQDLIGRDLSHWLIEK